jgi:ParB family chromosome partitioning protein
MNTKTRLGSDPLSWIKDSREEKIPEGVKLSEVHYIEISQIKPNPLNTKFFKKESDEYFETLTEDIKKRGILVPLILKENGMLLAGHNRLKIAFEINVERVPVQYIIGELTESQEREFLFKDNILRRQLTAKEKEFIIRELYKDEINKDNRGGDRKSLDALSKSSNELLITLPERIEIETGIKAGTAKRMLADIRKENKGHRLKKDPLQNISKHLKAVENSLKNESKDVINRAIKQLELTKKNIMKLY